LVALRSLDAREWHDATRFERSTRSRRPDLGIFTLLLQRLEYKVKKRVAVPFSKVMVYAFLSEDSICFFVSFGQPW
jgi:hypothetical protein